MNRLVNMLIRRATNMAVQKGIEVGAQNVGGPKNGSKPTKDQKAAMRRAKQSAKMMRRFSRF